LSVPNKAKMEKWADQAINSFVSVLSRQRYSLEIKEEIENLSFQRKFKISSNFGEFYLCFNVNIMNGHSFLSFFFYQKREIRDPYGLHSVNGRFRIFDDKWPKDHLPKIRQYVTSKMKTMIYKMQFASIHEIMNL